MDIKGGNRVISSFSNQTYTIIFLSQHFIVFSTNMAIRVVWFLHDFCGKIERRGLFRHLEIKLTVVYLLIFRYFGFWSYFLQIIRLCQFWLNVHLCQFFCEAGWYFWVKIDNFFMQNFSFCGAGLSFWYLFCHCFVIFSCKISVFCEAGRSF